MIREMGLNSILQCKRRISKDDLRFFHIRPSQHDWKYAYLALRHINQLDKISSKSKLSHGELLRSQRQKLLKVVVDRIAQLPDGSIPKKSLERTRQKLEKLLLSSSETNV